MRRFSVGRYFGPQVSPTGVCLNFFSVAMVEYPVIDYFIRKRNRFHIVLDAGMLKIKEPHLARTFVLLLTL